MRYTTAEPGRVFVLRLEDGEIVHEVIEKFADEQRIDAASLIIVGGADDGSRLVVGPAEDRGLPLEPMQQTLHHVHEVTGTGTLFRDTDGVPLVHCTWPAAATPAPLSAVFAKGCGSGM
nr:PPC domain-containing DNA-binding protein [uncultured Desulfobulbus sp.]